jgi:O-antigen/teichoic acid export membrane protein
MMVATNRQGAATAATVAEAAVNLGSSIYFASHFGAIGVAFGTFIGALVSVSMHFALSMHFSQTTVTISRSRLFLRGLLRPAIIAIPSLLLFPLWRSAVQTSRSLPISLLWGMSTLALAWFGTLNKAERHRLLNLSRNWRVSLSG